MSDIRDALEMICDDTWLVADRAVMRDREVELEKFAGQADLFVLDEQVYHDHTYHSPFMTHDLVHRWGDDDDVLIRVGGEDSDSLWEVQEYLDDALVTETRHAYRVLDTLYKIWSKTGLIPCWIPDAVWKKHVEENKDILLVDYHIDQEFIGAEVVIDQEFIEDDGKILVERYRTLDEDGNVNEYKVRHSRWQGSADYEIDHE